MFEIDFWQVSISEKSADAITARWTRPDTSRMAVVVIDAGFTEFGNKVADEVEARYGTSDVDLVVSTHPDRDHIEGLALVLERLNVGELLIHIPRLHGYTQDAVGGGRADELVHIAARRGTKVTEPFTGDVFLGGILTVAGPTPEYYRQLLQEQVTGVAAAKLLGRRALAGARRIALKILRDEPPETLIDDQGGTTARNNSSVILNVFADAQRFLFTGDAGVPALSQAADYMDARGLSANPINFLDVPHHGSHHNVDPVVLDRLLAPSRAVGISPTAFISSSDKDEDHPSPRVLNALKRRDCRVFTTEQGSILHSSADAPPRLDYHALSPMPWVDESEE
ncbi:MAG: MBL fold metallo-hydrolase [Gemmatimonadota bacterium]|nr:MBL fold metallo-hydrolase [Gemmatimonadota bacterium]